MTSPRAIPPGVTRVQLGTSRLEALDVRVLYHFLDRSWLHLGDSDPAPPPRRAGDYLHRIARNPIGVARSALGVLTGRAQRPRYSDRPAAELYAKTHFAPFYFAKGDRLAMADNSIDFIFSEHFLHHLFLDDAMEILAECRRVLRPGGVIRTVVPDADLRTYAPPEPAGFPDVRLPFTAPLKHKTRWSVYMLSEALRLAGFEPIPIRYCDREGRYIQNDPAKMRADFAGCPEPDYVFRLDYILRLDSLIVDGMKPA